MTIESGGFGLAARSLAWIQWTAVANIALCVVNHVINLKKKQPLEAVLPPFEEFTRDLDEAGDAPPLLA